jgi:hypothetical protein
MIRRPESFTNYRWPKKGDRLLLESRDWNRGVEFPQGDSCTRHGYIWNGYMSAATALIAICEDDPPKVRDGLNVLSLISVGMPVPLSRILT